MAAPFLSAKLDEVRSRWSVEALEAAFEQVEVVFEYSKLGGDDHVSLASGFENDYLRHLTRER